MTLLLVAMVAATFGLLLGCVLAARRADALREERDEARRRLQMLHVHRWRA